MHKAQGIRLTARLGALLLILLPALASAQQRPLLTEDPETVGAGRVLVEGGLEHDTDVRFESSGLDGNLLRVPLVGVSIGLSSIAELQIDGGFSRLAIKERHPAPLAGMVTATGDSSSDIEDLVIATKIRLTSEADATPAVGFRLATKLPNAGNESGLGLDTTDFFASLLVGKTVQSVRMVGNVGIGILADPIRGDRQNDVLTYGLSFARAITQAAEVVGEVNGRADTRNGEPPTGTGSRSTFRFGGRYTVGSLRADAAVLFGLTSSDPDFGIAAGFTYVFDGFTIP